jgi:chromosome segregation ATPase
METEQSETIRSAADSSQSNLTLEPHTTFLQRYPSITHFAVLAALLTPIAAVPYLLSKKRISALSRQLDNLSAATAVLRKELESSAIKRPKQNEPSAIVMALRSELESSLIESARQREELSFTATTLRKELEASATERAKQKEELSAATSILRKELETSAIERAKQKEQLKHTSASLEVARKEVSRLARNIEQLHAERETFVLTTESVQQLLQERKLTRQAESGIASSHDVLFIALYFL